MTRTEPETCGLNIVVIFMIILLALVLKHIIVRLHFLSYRKPVHRAYVKYHLFVFGVRVVCASCRVRVVLVATCR